MGRGSRLRGAWSTHEQTVIIVTARRDGRKESIEREYLKMQPTGIWLN